MTDIPKRTIRRHDRDRIILQGLRRKYWHVKSPGHLFKNNTVCSCWMCGNPRKYFGELTIQEKKSIQACIEGMTSSLNDSTNPSNPSNPTNPINQTNQKNYKVKNKDLTPRV
jgi:hypothetical protein